MENPDENFYYFTNLDGIWDRSFAIIYPDKIEIFSPPLEKGNFHFYRSKKELDKLLSNYLKVDKVGFNGERLTYRDYVYLKKITKAKLIDISNEIKKMRAIKSEKEIRLIKRACRIALDILNNFKFNKSEREMVIEIENEIRKKNAEPAFKTIVAFGKNTSIPHHSATNKKFCMPALIDLGAKYKRYCSDITRSYIKKKGKSIYEIVEEALYIAIDEIKEGIKAKEVYKKVEKFLEKYGYKMKHALGHSIGLLVHDGLSINKGANFEFKENMVFAIEPAIYTKSFGIRIEEDIVIRKNKAIIIR